MNNGHPMIAYHNQLNDPADLVEVMIEMLELVRDAVELARVLATATKAPRQ